MIRPTFIKRKKKHFFFHFNFPFDALNTTIHLPKIKGLNGMGCPNGHKCAQADLNTHKYLKKRETIHETHFRSNFCFWKVDNQTVAFSKQFSNSGRLLFLCVCVWRDYISTTWLEIWFGFQNGYKELMCFVFNFRLTPPNIRKNSDQQSTKTRSWWVFM